MGPRFSPAFLKSSAGVISKIEG